MSAKDQVHQQVVNALKKDGWTITHDPFKVRWKTRKLQVDLGAEKLIAAEKVWDTIGAQSAGLSAALIKRPGNALLPVYGLPQPNFVARDLQDLAAKLNETRQT